MKQKFRIIRDYKRSSNAAFMVRTSNVYNSMNGNSLFAQPPVLMEAFKQYADQLDAGMVDAQHRDRLKAAQKNDIIANLKEMLDQLADYVTAVAKGNEAVLLSSGFAVSSAFSPGTFGPVENFTVKIGPESGQVTVRVKPLYGATNYAVYYGIDQGDQTVLLHEFQPKTKFVLSGLQPGKTYAFQVKVAGPNNRKADSTVIKKVVF